MKSPPLIWHLLQSVKSTVKISSIFVAFLRNMNFNDKEKLGENMENSKVGKIQRSMMSWWT